MLDGGESIAVQFERLLAVGLRERLIELAEQLLGVGIALVPRF